MPPFQRQVIVSVERISERYLIPALDLQLKAFPFVIQGFHSDNGSEYINRQVAALLQKLHIELTKSRSRQTDDIAFQVYIRFQVYLAGYAKMWFILLIP